MAQSLPSTHIEAQIGNVSGGSMVAVGSNILQINRVEGDFVNVLKEPPPPPRLRPQPISLRPKAFPGLLDRETETTNVIQALQLQESVECIGEPGAGKTSLLRHLAYQPQLSIFSAGVIYFQVNQQSTADLLKSLFDACYTCDFPIKPTETEIRHYLQPVNALVLLDEVEITPEQIKSFMNVAVNCTFITTTMNRSLFGETREVTLKGLPADEAVSLFQRELGRTLSAEEERDVLVLCESLGCIPQRVLRAAHEVKEEKRSLADVIPEAQSASADEDLAAAAVRSRSEDEKKVLTALAVFYGAPVAAEHVAAVAGVTAVEQMLEDLEQRGLVQSHEQRYTLASDVKNAMSGDLKPWFIRAVVHFSNWTEQHRDQPQLIEAAAQSILIILRWAVAAKAWLEVKQLGHAVEGALTLSGKWDMWATALESIRTAAGAQHDDAESAWALHQLGTRSLCLGDCSAAEVSLREALGIRERLNDQRGAAVTRHNLNILLNPPLPGSEPGEPSGGGVTPGPTPFSLLAKLGILSLLGLALIGAVIVWRMWPPKPPVTPRVASFSVNPTTVRANTQAQLCYEVENAVSVRIEPNVGERKPASKECLTVTAAETTTYTLTAFASDGTTISQQVTLNIEAPTALAQILRFEVQRQINPNDVQFRLCYEVRNAARAEIDNDAGPVVLDRFNCQPVSPQQTTTYTLSATGTDGLTVTRQATVDANKPPPPLPEVLRFFAKRPDINSGERTELCFELKDASDVQIEPGVPDLQVRTGEQCVSIAPMRTTTYTLTALNSEGKSRNRTTVVTVRQPAAEIGRFFANPTFLERPGNVQLCFEVRNARRLQIDNGVGELRLANEGCANAKVDRTTTFTLSATGLDGGMAQSQAKVDVAPPPIEIEFTAEPENITPPNSASLCYRVSQASSISIDPGVGRLRPAVPGVRVCVKVQPEQTTTYTLTAIGSSNQTATRRVKVNVEERRLKHASILFFKPSSLQIREGESVRLCYGVADTIRASISPISEEIAILRESCIDHSPRQSTQYVLRAVGEDGQAETQDVTVKVEADRLPDAPAVKITRFDIKRPLLGNPQLCYAVENASSARIDPDFGELRKLPADCPRLKSLDQATYTLTATGRDGKTDQKSVSYTPPEPPRKIPITITSFSPESQTINSGAQARICYSTFGEGAAQISPMPGSVPPSLIKKCVTVSPKETTVYTLTVTSPEGQQDSRRVTVKVDQPGIVIR